MKVTKKWKNRHLHREVEEKKKERRIDLWRGEIRKQTIKETNEQSKEQRIYEKRKE